MTQNYNRPRQRARSFGAGLLSGSAVSQDGVMTKLQENIQFRLQSVRGMLMGQGEQGMNPLERRQEIRNRRQELLGQMGGPLGGGDNGGSSSDSGTGGSPGTSGSGNIGRTGTSTSTNDTASTKDSTPSMSEVDRGTKARAQERGYED